MDVEKEFKEVNYRIKAKARAQALAAEARIYGMNASNYAHWVVYAERLTRLEEARLAAERQQDAWEALGRAWGGVAKTVNEMVSSFSRGFQQGLS